MAVIGPPRQWGEIRRQAVRQKNAEDRGGERSARSRAPHAQPRPQADDGTGLRGGYSIPDRDCVTLQGVALAERHGEDAVAMRWRPERGFPGPDRWCLAARSKREALGMRTAGARTLHAGACRHGASTSTGRIGGAQCRVSRYPILVVTGAKTPASVNQSKPERGSSAML